MFGRVDLESPSAHAIHTVQTAAALARAGAQVVCHADVGAGGPEAVLRNYGVPASENLEFRHMGWRWHSAALPLVAGGLLGRGPAVLFLNQIRRYGLPLAGKAARRGFRILYEAHNAAGALALEAAGVHGEAAVHARPEALLSLGKVKPAPAGTSATPTAVPGGAPVESEEERAGRERAKPRPDPKAMAAAREREALEKAILSRADVLIAPQRLTLEAVKKMARPGIPSRVIPNGTVLPPPALPREKDIDILYCGSLAPWKGVDILIGALPRLFPYRLTIVGGRDETDRRRLQGIARELGVLGRVVFLPKVIPAQVWGIYARAKVGVVPLSRAFLEAREYTCPMKLIEMMAAGLPIVTSRLPSVQEYVEEGREVLMAASEDHDDFAAVIRRLLEDSDLAARLSAAARAKAEQFTYDRRASAILDLLVPSPA